MFCRTLKCVLTPLIKYLHNNKNYNRHWFYWESSGDRDNTTNECFSELVKKLCIYKIFGYVHAALVWELWLAVWNSFPFVAHINDLCYILLRVFFYSCVLLKRLLHYLCVKCVEMLPRHSACQNLYIYICKMDYWQKADFHTITLCTHFFKWFFTTDIKCFAQYVSLCSSCHTKRKRLNISIEHKNL